MNKKEQKMIAAREKKRLQHEKEQEEKRKKKKLNQVREAGRARAARERQGRELISLNSAAPVVPDRQRREASTSESLQPLLNTLVAAERQDEMRQGKKERLAQFEYPKTEAQLRHCFDAYVSQLDEYRHVLEQLTTMREESKRFPNTRRQRSLRPDFIGLVFQLLAVELLRLRYRDDPTVTILSEERVFQLFAKAYPDRQVIDNDSFVQYVSLDGVTIPDALVVRSTDSGDAIVSQEVHVTLSGEEEKVQKEIGAAERHNVRAGYCSIIAQPYGYVGMQLSNRDFRHLTSEKVDIEHIGVPVSSQDWARWHNEFRG